MAEQGLTKSLKACIEPKEKKHYWPQQSAYSGDRLIENIWASSLHGTSPLEEIYFKERSWHRSLVASSERSGKDNTNQGLTSGEPPSSGGWNSYQLTFGSQIYQRQRNKHVYYNDLDSNIPDYQTTSLHLSWIQKWANSGDTGLFY